MAEEDITPDPEETPVETTETPSTDPSVAQETPETPAKTEETATEGEDNILSYIRDQFGLDLTDKYADPEEGLRGLVEGYRKLGERNEDAQRWKQFQQAASGKSPEEIIALVSGQTPAQPKTPASDDWMAGVTAEQVRTWQALVDAGKAPADIQQKLASVQAKVYDAMLGFALSPEKAVAPFVQKHTKELEAKLQQVTQTDQERASQQAMRGWEEKNSSVLYVDGDASKGSTAIGQQAWKLYTTDKDLAFIPDPVGRANKALQLAMADQPRSAVPRRPGVKAMRQPAVAAPPKTMMSADEFFAQYKGPDERAMEAYLKHKATFATAIE
jgi:hypothetical protein